LSLENRKIRCGTTVFVHRKSTRQRYKLMRGRRPGVVEPCMMHNVRSATRETLPALRKRSMAYNAANGESQMAARESDTVIVPWISGNADVGKDEYTIRT